MTTSQWLIITGLLIATNVVAMARWSALADAQRCTEPADHPAPCRCRCGATTTEGTTR